jgi:hypothetical protein
MIGAQKIPMSAVQIPLPFEDLDVSITMLQHSQQSLSFAKWPEFEAKLNFYWEISLQFPAVNLDRLGADLVYELNDNHSDDDFSRLNLWSVQ